MSTAYATAQIEIRSPVIISPKTAHLLRRALGDALEEAADRVLDQFGIPNEEVHSVLVDEVEVQDETEATFVD